MNRSLRALALALVLSTSATAQDDELVAVTPSDTAAPKVSDSQLNIRGIFNSPLPGTEEKNSLRLAVHPHMGDFSKYDVLRTTIGLRYGIGRQLELNGETDAYFSHGFGRTRFFEQAGFGRAGLGAKYNFGGSLLRDWDTAVGVGFNRPVGRPPAEITDGLGHTTAFITFARPLASAPHVRFFWGTGIDLVSTTSIAGHPEKNDLRDDAQSFTTGFVWARGALDHTFETTYATTRILGRTRDDVFTIRPGFVWSIPRRFTFNSRGQWLLGAALNASHGPDGTSLGASAKLRLSFDFKGLWRRMRHRELSRAP